MPRSRLELFVLIRGQPDVHADTFLDFFHGLFCTAKVTLRRELFRGAIKICIEPLELRSVTVIGKSFRLGDFSRTKEPSFDLP